MSTSNNDENSLFYRRKISDDNQTQKKINILSTKIKLKQPLKAKLYLDCRPVPNKINKHIKFGSDLTNYREDGENFNIIRRKKKYPSLSPTQFCINTGILEMKSKQNNAEKMASFLPRINLKTNECNYEGHNKIKLSKIPNNKFYATNNNFNFKNSGNYNSIKIENKQKFRIIKEKNYNLFRKTSGDEVPISNNENINFKSVNFENNNDDDKFVNMIKFENENLIKEKIPIEEKLEIKNEEKEEKEISNTNVSESDNENEDNKLEIKNKKKPYKIFLAKSINNTDEEKNKEINKEILSEEIIDNENEKINDSSSKIETIKNNFVNKTSTKEILNNHLHNIKINSACVTKEGMSNSQPKINQDSYLILEKIFDSNFYIFGIYDGHGKDGHLISNYVSKYMNEYFLNIENYIDIFPELKDKEKFNKIIFEKSIDMIKNCQNKLDNKILNKNIDFDIKFSGTTNLMLFIIGNKLICSNIGDSRCVLFTCTEEEKWDFIELSNDHNPQNEKEKKRILKMGGEIHPYYDEKGNFEGPDRIYEKGKPYPGLSLSRTVGDIEGKKIGIISEPEIIFKNIENDFKYIVMGSDGLWDQVRPYDIIRIVRPFFKKKNPDGACQAILKRAVQNWDKSDDERDDVTVMVIFIEK